MPLLPHSRSVYVLDCEIKKKKNKKNRNKSRLGQLSVTKQSIESHSHDFLNNYFIQSIN